MREQSDLLKELQNQLDYYEVSKPVFQKYADLAISGVDLSKCYDVPYLLHRKMMDETNCVVSLCNSKAFFGVAAHTRTVFEAAIQAHYLLEHLDACIHYVIFEGVQAKKWTKETIENINSKLSKSGFKENIPQEIMDNLKKQLVSQDAFIKYHTNNWKIPITRVTQGGKTVASKSWYENYSGFTQIVDLAEAVGKIAGYAVDYFTWSRSAHASSVYQEYKPQMEHGTYFLNKPEIIDQNVISNIANCRLLQLEVVFKLIAKFKPELEKEINKTYVEATHRFYPK